MPSVAACDAAGAISATAHAASKVVLIRIRAPGEELESQWSPEHSFETGRSSPQPWYGRHAGSWCGYPARQPSEETRQPSSLTGTSVTVSWDGVCPEAAVRTSALALFSSLATVIFP